MKFYEPNEVCTVGEALESFGVNLPFDAPSGMIVTKKPSRFLANSDGTLFVRCNGIALVGWQGLVKCTNREQFFATSHSIYLVVDGDRLKVVHYAGL